MPNQKKGNQANNRQVEHLASRVAQLLRQSPRQKRNSGSRKGSKAPKMKAPIDLRGSSSAELYRNAILHPFAKQAAGARVPDPFSVASSVDTAHISWTVGTTAVSSQSFDCILTPHLLQSIHSGKGAVSGGIAGTVIGTLPSSVTCRAISDQATIAARYKSYRLVAWGVRIKPNVSYTNAGGRIYVAVVPATQQMPICTRSDITKSDWYDCLEAPYDTTAGSLPSTLLNMPRSRQFTMTELIACGGVELTLPLTSPAAKTFLEAKSEDKEQSLVVGAPGTSLIAGGVSAGYASTAGFSQVLLYGEGVGTAGTATDVLSIDVVYHVEYIPNISAVSGALVSAAPYTPSPVSPMAEHSVHAAVARAPIFQAVLDKAKEEAKKFTQAKVTDFFKKHAPQAEAVLGLI